MSTLFLGHRIDYLSNDVSIFSEVCAEKSFFPLGVTGVQAKSALVAPRGNNFFCNLLFWFGLVFPDVFRPFDKSGQKNFGRFFSLDACSSFM